MYDEILIPYDGSAGARLAFGPARDLARWWGCPVAAAHVTPHGQPAIAGPTEGVAVRTLHGTDVAATLREELSSEGGHRRLLTMSTRARRSIGERLFGGTTATLLRTLHRPLVLVGPALTASASPSVPRILVPLDGSAVARSILPVARRWAVELGAPLLLLHVAYPLGGPRVGDVVVPEEEREIDAWLHGYGDELRAGGIDARVEVTEGVTAARGILERASSFGADMIAMATHGRTGLERLLVGSSTAEVVRASPIPVLALRPEGLA